MSIRSGARSLTLLIVAITTVIIFQNCSGQMSSTNGSAPDRSSVTTAVPVSLSAETEIITSLHRWSAQMYGGWGAHLGHLLRNAQDELWYVDDTGNDVNRNGGFAYYKRIGTTWAPAGFQGITGTIQQNAASLMIGNMIFTYGLDVENHVVQECYFDTTRSYQACNHLPFEIPPSSNYIGATVSASGSRVVWWTTVINGGGTWSYIYNFGGGWNGPVTSTLNGYADLSYVHGRLLNDNLTLVVSGACAKGLGGSGVGYDAISGSTSLGNAVTNWQTLLVNGLTYESWLDPKEGAYHFVSAGTNLRAFYRPKDGGPLVELAEIVQPNVVSARILENGETVRLLLATSDGNIQIKSLPQSAFSAVIDWNSVETSTLEKLTPSGAGTLFPESRMYQTTPPKAGVVVNSLATQGVLRYLTLKPNPSF